MNIAHHSHHLRSLYVIALLLIDGFFFGMTDPTKIASFGLIVGYLLVVVSVYVVLRICSRLLRYYSQAASQRGQRLAQVITGVVAVLLGMQSVGQLSAKDIAALVPLVVIGYFYLSYTRRPV